MLWDYLSRGVLMDKSGSQAASGAASSLINQANATMNPLISGLESDRTAWAAAAADRYNQAVEGFTNQQQTGGYDPTQLTSLRNEFTGMLPTGGYDPTQLATIRGDYASNIPTGGYDPTQLGNLRTQLSTAYTSGGMNPDQLAKLESGYGNLADTGGYSDPMKSQFLKQATSGNRNLTAALASAASRNAASTGGNAQAGIADIQRRGGQTEATTTSNAMLGLGQQILQGKEAGLSGLGTTEAQLAAGRQGIAGQQIGLESGVSAGARDLMSQRTNLESDVAGGARQIAGLQSGLESGVASGVQKANVGLQGLFDTTSGQVTALGNQILQGLGLQFGTEAEGAQILAALSRNPGVLQTLIGDIGQLAGAASKGAQAYAMTQ